MTLRLAKDLTLPVDVVTQTIAILAKRRAGKSYTMRRLVEQLVHAGQQVVLVDPKGDQWGVRSAADGKGPGLPLVILGGERADVPLEASSGEVVAKLVVEERVSAVLDLSLFRKHEVATFMTGFMEALYRLKAREIYRTPMMLVIDEADAIAPQKPQKGEERMLGAAEDIVRRGGQRGIGCVLVSQRSAVLNKNVLTQAQILIVLRTIAPQDLVAMKAWVDVHGTDDEGAELMDSLPSLPVGDAWVWSPGWPTVDGIFKRVQVLPIETFDSGASPKPGEQRREPKTVADVDLEALKRQMSATIEKAKAESPRELQKKVRELEAALRAKDQGPRTNSQLPTPKVVEKLVVTDAQLDRMDKAIDRAEVLVTRALGIVGNIQKFREPIVELTAAVKSARQPAPAAAARVVQPRASYAPERAKHSPRPPVDASGNGSEPLSGPEAKILASLAELEALNLHPADKQQLGLMAGYTNVRSGGFSEPLGRLVQRGYVTSPRAGVVAITDQGPNEMTKDELAAACDPPYTNIRSGGFSEPLGRLNTLGIVRSPDRGVVVAAPALFLEA